MCSYCDSVQTLVARLLRDGSNDIFVSLKQWSDPARVGNGLETWTCRAMKAVFYSNPACTSKEFGRYGMSGNLCHSVCYCLPHSSCHKWFSHFLRKSVDELNKYAFRVAVMTKCIIIQIYEKVPCNIPNANKAYLCWFRYKPFLYCIWSTEYWKKFLYNNKVKIKNKLSYWQFQLFLEVVLLTLTDQNLLLTLIYLLTCK